MLQKKFCGLVILVLLTGFSVFSQIPRLISYQGYLTDASGVPLNGTHEITFRLYVTPEPSSAVWTEIQTLEVQNGLFNVNLGSVSELTPEFDVPYYLGVTLDEGEELLPLIALTSSPYSLNPPTFPVPIKLVENLDEPVVNITNLGLKDAIVGLNQYRPPGNFGKLGNLYYGVYGENGNKNKGYLGGELEGTYGEHQNSGNFGYFGSGDFGVFGKNPNGNTQGYIAGKDTAVEGVHYNNSGSIDLKGQLATKNFGVWGESLDDSWRAWGYLAGGEPGELAGAYGGTYYSKDTTYGCFAATGNLINRIGRTGTHSCGVFGFEADKKNWGYIAYKEAGVFGTYVDRGYKGWLGNKFAGVHGQNADSTNNGMLATENSGVYGSGIEYGVEAYSPVGIAVYGESEYGFAIRGWNSDSRVFGYIGGMGIGVYGRCTDDMNKWGYLGGKNYSGAFGEHVLISGNCEIGGNLIKAGGQFKIDHPLDPENKYLNHSFVESPERTNIYNGNIILDSNGEAVVLLPDWFQALNKDFKYQLTAIGGPGPGLYISEEIMNNRFKIAGGSPGLKVSWMVTGVRQDPWANANPLLVEEEKEPQLRGYYVHPELFNQPGEMQIEYARNPEMMKSVTISAENLEPNLK